MGIYVSVHGLLGTRKLSVVYGKIQKVGIPFIKATSLLEPGIGKFKFPII